MIGLVARLAEVRVKLIDDDETAASNAVESHELTSHGWLVSVVDDTAG